MNLFINTTHFKSIYGIYNKIGIGDVLISNKTTAVMKSVNDTILQTCFERIHIKKLIKLIKSKSNIQFYVLIACTKKCCVLKTNKIIISDLLYIIAHFCEKNKCFIDAKKYYLLAADNGHKDAICALADMHANKLKDLKTAEKFYLIAIENNNLDAMYNLAHLYVNTKRDEDAEKYFLMGVELNDVDSMNALGDLYYNMKKFNDAIKYYLMALEQNNISKIINIANAYYYLENYTDAKKYYLMAFKHGNVDCIEGFKRVSNIFERYLLSKSDNIDFGDNYNRRDIMIFANKLTFMKKVMYCPVCLDEMDCIPLECSHYLCTTCYPKIIQSKICPVCRTSL